MAQNGVNIEVCQLWKIPNIRISGWMYARESADFSYEQPHRNGYYFSHVLNKLKPCAKCI